MKAGRMRHWIRLEQPTTSKDGFGGVVKTWVPVVEVDAAVDAISGREFLAADRELAGATWRITLREVPGVTVEPNWRGVVLDDDADPRVLDFVAVLPSHDRAELTIAATGGTSQP
jgi:head-tail adaptor